MHLADLHSDYLVMNKKTLSKLKILPAMMDIWLTAKKCYVLLNLINVTKALK